MTLFLIFIDFSIIRYRKQDKMYKFFRLFTHWNCLYAHVASKMQKNKLFMHRTQKIIENQRKVRYTKSINQSVF